MQVQLERIIAFNFKSFKGEVIIGPIKPFTAIIGANGSGKSNIMDAVSFVMGEKVRNLRVKQLSDLIYGASWGEPISNRAYVTAVFLFEDNNVKTFTRNICHNACVYKVDNQVVVVQEYMSELSRLNLNIKAKNFLVFQGTVDSTIMKTPKEYTHMLEEMSNSIELKKEYERLKDQILKGGNEIQYLHNKKKDLLINKKYALSEKQEADKYENLHNQFLKTKKMLYIFELFHIQKDIQDLQITLRDMQLEISEYENQKDTASDFLKERKKQLETALKDLENIEQCIAIVESDVIKKEAYFAESKEKVIYWEQKLNSTNLLLLEAQKTNKSHVKVIKELENELKQMAHIMSMFEGNMTTQLLSQGSSVELNDIQVKEYSSLKQRAEAQCLEHVQRCNSLKRQQDINQNKLDNESRKKYELETALHQKTILRDETQKRIRNIEQYMNKTQSSLTEKSNEKYNFEDTIAKRKRDIESMQQELQLVSEQLDTAKMDKYTSVRLDNESKTINILQSHFSGVYGRLYNLCKPIHSRYEVAMTKVFGKFCNSIVVSSNKVAIQCIAYLKEHQIGCETFLPVNDLKVNLLSEIRGISKVRNVKLLYDAIEFAPAEISNAILFATKNAFVCETAEDARMLAYELDPQHKNNCVAIDGTYYMKQGLISGGQVELKQKAKIWQEQHLVELKSRKETLLEKLNKKMKISQIEFEMSTLNIHIQAHRKRLDYCRRDLTDANNKLSALQNEIKITRNELQQVNDEVTVIQNIMEEKNQEIEDIEQSITNIEGLVFENFCRKVGISNIRQYEQGNLRLYQDQMKRRLKLEEQCTRIRNLLDFEMERDTETPVFKMEKSLRAAKEELEKTRQEQALRKANNERKIEKLNDLKKKLDKAKGNFNEAKQNVDVCKRNISVIAKSIINAQKELIAITTNIKKKKARCYAIIKNSKMESIAIPLLPEDDSNNSEDVQMSTENGSSIVEERHCTEILPRVDFRKLPEDLKTCGKEEIESSRNTFQKEIERLQNEMVSIKTPNFKADKELQFAIDKLKEINLLHQEMRKNVDRIKRQYEKIKQQRYDRFTECLEHITTELDFIYKCLLKDQSAQAILLPDNPEEPYLGDIYYSCIMPGKRFQSFSNLSGGEKTLAVLAFLFAAHSFRPAPFFVLDEIDAALDVINIKNVVRFLRSKAKEMQFIIVSLKRDLYSHADALIGICSDNKGAYPQSVVYSLSLKKYEAEYAE